MSPFEREQIADLVDVFGSAFIAYVLNLEGEVTVEELLADLHPSQVAALQVLGRLREPHRPASGTPEGAAWASRHNIDQYVPEAGASLPNLLRIQSGGTVPPPRTAADPVLDALYEMLMDTYPALMLPQESPGLGAPISGTVFNHPLRAALESAVLADPALAKLYSEESATSGWSGSVFRSTGQGGGVQLWGFASQQIAMAHAWASLATSLPTVDEVADKLALSVAAIRQALDGESVAVPMLVGLTGVLLPDELDQLDLGWGTLRRATEIDSRIAGRTGVAGKLQTTQPDGTVVTIDYAGDVVLTLEVPYKISVGEMKPGKGWRPELAAVQVAAAQDVESLRLALALALEDNQPALVVQSWQMTIDPLASAALPGWNDTRRTPNLLPRQLKREQVEAWAVWSQRVRTNRTPTTAVSVRRMLQALGERHNQEDVLVDAVVVWENLFGASQETTLRICTALAWLLGKDAADRAKRQSQYKKLYTLRSNIVHGSAKVASDKVPGAARETVQISLSALRELFEHRPELLAEDSSESRGNKLLLDVKS